MGFSKVFKSIPRDIVEWGRFFATLQPDAGTIPDASLEDRAGNSVFGRAEGTSGPAADIVATGDRQFLVLRSGVLQFDGAEVADLPTSLATDDEVAAAQAAAEATAATALADHVAAADPHPVYTTATELATAISTHVADSDPHPVYLTQTEGDTRYLQQSLTLTNAVDDAAAATAGVAVGHLYRNGSVVMIRVT